MNRKAFFVSALIVAAVVAPVAVYVIVFGFSLSPDHSRWAEFGSAIGGIYSPLVAFLTLGVLRKQVQLQAQMNAHIGDHAFLEQARRDVEFYCTQLAQVMGTGVLQNKSLREVLHDQFWRVNAVDLDSERLRHLADEIHRLFPGAIDLWGAIYPILTGLSVPKSPMYVMTYESSKQKLIAILSFRTCVALDNLYRTLTEGELKIRYEFSSLLSS